MSVSRMVGAVMCFLDFCLFLINFLFFSPSSSYSCFSVLCETTVVSDGEIHRMLAAELDRSEEADHVRSERGQNGSVYSGPRAAF